MSSLSVLLIAGLAAPASSSPSLRQLCVEATTVVQARPLDPVTPLRFHTLAVLRGRAPAEFAPAGLAVEMVRGNEEVDLETGKARLRRNAQALLFLDGKGRLLKGGLRLCSEDGRVVGLTAVDLPEVRPGQRWADVLARVRADVAAADQLAARRRMARPTQRVAAVLDWLQRRRGELSAVPPEKQDDLAPVGWGRLVLEVFDECLRGVAPADAWPVVELFAELNAGELPSAAPAFATPAGRAFLVQVGASDGKKIGERARALRLLGRLDTLREATAEELGRMLERLTPVLEVKHDELRGAALVPVMHIALRKELRPQAERLVPTLEAVYRASAFGPGRNELAQALSRLATPARWKELTGNPAGVCATLRDLERGPATLTFWLELRTSGAKVHEQPTLVLERVGPLGLAAETRRLPLAPLALPGNWASGWEAAVPLAVRQEMAGLQPGQTYRLRVEGTIGKGGDRQKWTSEPLRFGVPAAPTPERGRVIRGSRILP